MCSSRGSMGASATWSGCRCESCWMLSKNWGSTSIRRRSYDDVVMMAAGPGSAGLFVSPAPLAAAPGVSHFGGPA